MEGGSDVKTMPAPQAPLATTGTGMPESDAMRENLLDAVIVACAFLARGQAAVSAAARMSLLAETRRRELLGTPPGRDVFAQLRDQMSRMSEPRAARRLLARATNRFVGSPWAATIIEIATAFSAGCPAYGEPNETAISSLRVALGVPPPRNCGEP